MKANYIEADFEAAQRIYSSAEPSLLGRLVLSQEDATGLPIDLNTVYAAAYEAISKQPDQACVHASTFGATNVRVALNDDPTSYSYDPIQGFQPANSVEIATVSKRKLVDIFTVADVDSPQTYVLAEDPAQPVLVEIGLVQALHMIDTALVTGTFQTEPPRVVVASNDELLRLKAMNPDQVFLRLYGDVRKQQQGIKLLGSVVSSSLLEKSGIETVVPNMARPAARQIRETITLIERQPAVFAGITIAKRPHLGHGLLLVKALAESGQNRALLVELNDRGPRVDAALAQLSKSQEIDTQTVLERVTNGSIPFDAIEDAYKQRESTLAIDTSAGFRLKAPEDYYRGLLAAIAPESVNMIVSADSEMQPLQDALAQNPSYLELFNGEMALLRSTEQLAVPIKTADSLTVAGLFAALSTRYALRLADSPPPLSTSQRNTFKSAGLGIEQASGMGIMFDFELGSGTNGKSIPLAKLVGIATEITGNPKLTLPIIRAMLENGYLLPSDGASCSLNFAKTEVAIEAFKAAAEKVVTLDDPEEQLYKPIKLVNIKKDIVTSLLSHELAIGSMNSRPSVGNIQKLIECFPSIKAQMSPLLVDYASENTDIDAVVPRNKYLPSDRKLIQTIINPNPDVITPLLLELARRDPVRFAVMAQGSLLSPIMAAMGYPANQASDFLNSINDVRGVFKTV